MINYTGGLRDYRTDERIVFDSRITWTPTKCSNITCKETGVFPDGGKQKQHFCFKHNPRVMLFLKKK